MLDINFQRVLSIYESLLLIKMYRCLVDFSALETLTVVVVKEAYQPSGI